MSSESKMEENNDNDNEREKNIITADADQLPVVDIVEKNDKRGKTMSTSDKTSTVTDTLNGEGSGVVAYDNNNVTNNTIGNMSFNGSDGSQTTTTVPMDDSHDMESKSAPSSTEQKKQRKRLFHTVADQIRENRRRHLQKLRQIQEEQQQQQAILQTGTGNDPNNTVNTTAIRPKRSIIEDHFRIESIVQPAPVPVLPVVPPVPVPMTTIIKNNEMARIADTEHASDTTLIDTTSTNNKMTTSVTAVPNVFDQPTQQQMQQQVRQRSFGQFFSNTTLYKSRGYNNKNSTEYRSDDSGMVATKTDRSSGSNSTTVTSNVMRSIRTRRLQQQQTAAAAGSTKNKVQIPKRRIVVLPGVPTYEEDWARDSHDFFNLVALVPVVALNVMNWNWDIIFIGCTKIYSQYKKYYYFQSIIIHHYLLQLYISLFTNDTSNTASSNSNKYSRYNNNLYNPKDDIAFIKVLETSWTDEWFETFFICTVCYFIIDLLWVYAIPQAVRSPLTIIQHHIATLCYIIIPYWFPQCRWVMGACMIVEINTWFLIARRVFNKQGFPPWTIVDFSFLSIRIKIISIMFYTTWISIRCILYPLLVLPIYTLYINEWKRTNNMFNLIGLCLPLHTIFCMLNIKWSYDLLMSKIRYWRRLHTIRKNSASANIDGSPTNNKATNKYIADHNNNYVDKGL